jgi:threonine dehydrogenase-like Zn-dependent dehydrogenase
MTPSMKALRFDGRTIELADLPRPRPRPGEALVRVRLAGICSTDLEILRGYLSFRGVPGHEFVGTVVSSPLKRLAGARVTGEINVPCGTCELCAAGLGKHCASRSVLGISGRAGAFAEYLALPVGNLHVVPRALSDEEAAFTELVAAACEITERVAIGRADRVLVLGDGRLAAMAAQVVAARTPRVAVLGLNRAKLAAIARLGVETLDGARSAGPGRPYDVVIECTGSPSGLPLAASLVRPRGTIVLKSTYEAELRWNPSSIAVDEITIVGSRCGPFPRALELMRTGKVKVLPFLSAVYPLARWRGALRAARRAGSFKVLIRMP